MHSVPTQGLEDRLVDDPVQLVRVVIPVDDSGRRSLGSGNRGLHHSPKPPLGEVDASNGLRILDHWMCNGARPAGETNVALLAAEQCRRALEALAA
jgi:hypothetical protein